MSNSEIQLKVLGLYNTNLVLKAEMNLVSGDTFWSRSFY